MVDSNVAGSDGGGIYLNQCNQGCTLSVDGNLFVNNAAGDQGGGYYQSSNFAANDSWGTFNGNTVISNTAGSDGGGIYMSGDIANNGGRAEFNNNWIADNRSNGAGGGMRIDDMADSATTQFIGNTVINNLAVDGDGGGIRMDDIAYYGSLVTFQDNVISGNVISSTSSYNGGGIRIYSVGDGDTVWINGNVFNNNVATGKGGGFFWDDDISYASELYFDNNELQNNQALEGGGCYFDDDWEDGGPVTFRNNIVNNNTALGNYGGCYFNTIDEGMVAIISGNAFNNNSAAGDHGGVYIEDVNDGASLYFSNNEIRGNRAGISATQVTGGDYGGMYIRSIYDGGKVYFSNNQILSNTAYLTYTLGITPTGGSYGGLYTNLETAGELVMVGNSIAENSAQGGYGGVAINIQAARLEMENNLISANTAVTESGGLYITGTLNAIYDLSRNQIVNNDASSQDGLAILSGDGTIWGLSENNLIAGHDGGGVYLNNADFRSTNDTIANNGPFGLMMTGTITSTAWLSNSIVWGNNASFSTTLPLAFDMEATYSDIEGSWPGTGNIDADPLFVGGNDYRLTPTSPALDQVDPAMAPAIDLAGTARPVGGLADMGAYEWFLVQFELFLPIILR